MRHVFETWRTWGDARPALARHLSAEDVAALGAAVQYASACHGQQQTPSGDPYLRHLLQVVEVLVEGAGVVDRDVLVAAVLHDVVEDTSCTAREVAECFGDRVAGIVGHVTIQPAGPDGDAVAARRRYLESLPGAPRDALLVKLADRVANVQRLDAHPRPAKQRSYYRETVDYIEPLAEQEPWFRRWFADWRVRFQHVET